LYQEWREVLYFSHIWEIILSQTYRNALDNKQLDLKVSQGAHIQNKGQDQQLSFMEGATSTRPEFEGLNYIGIVFNTYILFSKSDQLYMMDQHAAHERVRFEMYMKSFKSDSIRIQYLLDPIIMDLSPTDMEVAIRNIQRCISTFYTAKRGKGSSNNIRL